MKIRVETAVLLKQISTYHYPGSASDLAEFTGHNDITLRRRLKALAQAGYLRTETRRIFYPVQGMRPTAYYWISMAGQAVVDRYASRGLPEPKPKVRPAERSVQIPQFSTRGIPNSVFALGQL